MPRKHHKPEEIVAKLRQVDVLTSQGRSVADSIRAIGVTEVTYYRWRQEYGGLKSDQVKRMKDLEAENTRLRRAPWQSRKAAGPGKSDFSAMSKTVHFRSRGRSRDWRTGTTICMSALKPGRRDTGFTAKFHALGHDCMVVAPALIPKRSGERIKTNRRDAVTLARLHRAGELTGVWAPDTAHEAVRDLVRAREAAADDLRRKRQQLLSFLLRHSRIYSGGAGGRNRALSPSPFGSPARVRHNISLPDSAQHVDYCS